MLSNFVRLSNGYFWYFAVLGLAMPFLAVFLEGRGFNSRQIGELLAIFTATKIVGPSFWAFFADKTGKQLVVIQVASTLAMISFFGLFFVDGYWPIAIVLALFSLFWTGMLPQLEVLTLHSMRKSAKFYARIRLWGSLGFIALAVLSGEVIASQGSETFVLLGLVVLIGLWLSTLLMRDKRGRAPSEIDTSSMLTPLMSRNFILFFVAGLLLQLSFGPYYSFFALYIRDLGHPSYAVGLLIGVSVVIEVATFILAGRIFKRFSVYHLLIFSFLSTALRWLLMGLWGEHIALLVFTQLIHAASYALYHSASMQFIQHHFRENQQNRAQALYISGVYGVGGAIGAYAAGLLWLDGNGLMQTHVAAAITALLAGIISLAMNKKQLES